MSQPVQIKNALISVYYKDNLEPIIQELSRLGVIIYSTGGTETFIRNLGVDVIAVEDLTSYPSILGGRVKTLHPKVFGGILARRNFEFVRSFTGSDLVQWRPLLRSGKKGVPRTRIEHDLSGMWRIGQVC